MDSVTTKGSFNRDFKLMVLGQIISILGAALLRFGLSLYVLDTTGREDIFAALYAISSIPLLLSPIGGAIADRFNRRNLMVIFDFTSSAIIFCSVYILSDGHPSVPVVGVVMFLLAVISAMYQPSVQSSIPVLVRDEKLSQANGIVNGVAAASGLVAPVLGGFLYNLLGLRPLLISSGVAFFLSATMEIFIKIPFTRRRRQGSIVKTIARDMGEGFAFIVKEPIILKALILAALINLLLTPFFIVGGPIILRLTLQSSDTMYGIGMGIIQLSSIIGALAIGLFAKKMMINRLHRWLIAATLMIIPMVLAVTPIVLNLGYMPSFLLLFLGAAPICTALSIVSIFVLTRVQQETPNALLGKVVAIVMSGAQCAAPIGQLIYGVLFKAFSSTIYCVILLMLVAMALMSALARAMLRKETI